MKRIIVAVAVVALCACGSGGTGGSGGSGGGTSAGGGTGGGSAGGGTGGGTSAGGGTGGGTSAGGGAGGGTGGAAGGGTGGGTAGGGAGGGAAGGGVGGGGGAGGGAFDAGPFLTGSPREEHVGDGTESTWIQLGPDGQPRIAWNRQSTALVGGALFFSTRSADGGWAAQQVDTNGPGRSIGENVRFVLDGTGKPHLLYRSAPDAGPQNTNELRYATFDGTNWTVERPQPGGTPRLDLDIRLGSDGQPRIVFGLTNAASNDAGFTDGGGPNDTIVVYSARSAAGTWSPQEMERSGIRTSAANQFGRGLTMVLDNQGNAHAFYEARISFDGGAPVKDTLRHNTNTAGAWAADTVYAGLGIGTDVVFGNAALGPAGVVWVAASGGSGSFVFRQGLGGTWVNASSSPFFPGINYFRLALSSNAIPWQVATSSLSDGRRVFVWRDPPGGTMVQSTPVHRGFAFVPSLALDSNNRPHVSVMVSPDSNMGSGTNDAGVKYLYFP